MGTLAQASAQFELSVAERAVLEGTVRHYRAEMPLDPSFKLAAASIIDTVRARRRAGMLDAAIGRAIRRMPLRRRRIGSRISGRPAHETCSGADVSGRSDPLPGVSLQS